jgi:hypothetical protein
MLEICEAFLQQKHPDPIIDLEEEENEPLWNKVVEIYIHVKAFLEVFWFDSQLYK